MKFLYSIILFLCIATLLSFSYVTNSPTIETLPIVWWVQKANIIESTWQLSLSPEDSGTTTLPAYLDSLSDFQNLPEDHKESVGYIFVTSSNLDIRWKDMSPEEYFKAIYFYNDGKLQSFDFSDTTGLEKLYKNAKKYINIIAERKLDRFSVGFTTKTYANNSKKPDIYLSSEYLSSILFIHEFGHVLDYRYGYTDINAHVYPYIKRINAITEYGKFHIGEDFAEAYRFYVLHGSLFREMTQDNKEILQKYEYMKKYVFSWKEYGDE